MRISFSIQSIVKSLRTTDYFYCNGMIFLVLIALVFASGCLADVSHILPEYNHEQTTPPPPPRPYNFQYSAGRFPGHVDRVQQESSDGFGVIRGSYSYVDPKQKIRTVQYTADKNGFHPQLVNFEDTQALPQDTEAVKLAKDKHFALYQRIADRNAQGVSPYTPRETVSVARAKDKHFALFRKISEEHAAIAAQRNAERLAYEATSVPNDVEEAHVYFN